MSIEFWNNIWGSIVNFFCTFPDQLFNTNPDTALMAWALIFAGLTLIVSISIPIVLAISSGKSVSKQSDMLNQLTIAAQNTEKQSLVELLNATLDRNTAEKYYDLVDKWDSDSIRDLGLRKIRMQRAVPLPYSSGSIERSNNINRECWIDYSDTFEERWNDSPKKFISQVGKFTKHMKKYLLEEDYYNLAKIIFSDDLPPNYDIQIMVREIFRDIPEIIDGSLAYTLNWPISENANNIILTVDSLVFIFIRDALSDEKYKIHKNEISQQIADFINGQSYRNIDEIKFSNHGEILLTACQIVYLAGVSAKVHGGEGPVDHLKMRMIEGIPDLFRNIISFDDISLDWSDRMEIKEFWKTGSEKLKDDEPIVWKHNWSRIEPIDQLIRNL